MPLEEKNPVLMLNDIRKDCVYQELGDAENSERRFIFKLSIDGKTFEGAGPNKKTAKAAAANRALMHPAVNPNASAYKAQQQKKNQKQNKQQGNQNKKSQPNPGLASGKKPQPNIGNNKMMFGNNGMQFRNTGMQYNNAGMHLHNTGMQFGKNSLTERGFNMMKSPMVNNDDVYVDGRKVCPFYLNSMCVKGNLCQFYHPTYSSRLDSAISSERQNVYQRLEMPQSSTSQQVPSGDTFTWLQFCQNYSHLRCPRTDCKFLHVSRDEEEVVRASGRIPSHIVEQAVRKAMLDDIAPAGVTQPCKAYLEGQCSWYSCPFRHISRQEFSHEVVDLLRKEFENRVKPGSDYRLLANRLLDRDPFSQESRRPIDRPNYPYDKDMGLGSLSRREDYLMSGMKSLSLDQNFTAKQREVEDLRSQLNMLHDENERLRNDMRMRSEDEKLMELKRRELMHEELRMQERFEKLKAENESLRGLRGNSFSIPSQHITGNAAYGPNYYSELLILLPFLGHSAVPVSVGKTYAQFQVGGPSARFTPASNPSSPLTFTPSPPTPPPPPPLPPSSLPSSVAPPPCTQTSHSSSGDLNGSINSRVHSSANGKVVMIGSGGGVNVNGTLKHALLQDLKQELKRDGRHDVDSGALHSKTDLLRLF